MWGQNPISALPLCVCSVALAVERPGTFILFEKSALNIFGDARYFRGLILCWTAI